jgi:hypothetical protein
VSLIGGGSDFVQVEVRGLQRLQIKNRIAMAAWQPGGPAEYDLREALLRLHAFAIRVTPVWTGTWQAAHRMEFTAVSSGTGAVHEYRGRLFVTSAASNPITGESPAVYGADVERKGVSPKGHQSPYKRTMAEEVPRVVKMYEAQMTVNIRGIYQ